MVGALKRDAFEFVEEVVFMRALRDMNLLKFVFDDVLFFLGLIVDLFFGLDCLCVWYFIFNDVIE